MTKRSNPFVEDYLSQSKTHVGLKQFNNNEDRMQKVYEKTLQLLFKGAKKAPENMGKNLENIPMIRKDCMRQLLINTDGTLMNSKIIDLEKHCYVEECHCGSIQVDTQCSYCESPLCTACSRLCTRCYLAFCSKCSISGSEDSEICVSCYG